MCLLHPVLFLSELKMEVKIFLQIEAKIDTFKKTDILISEVAEIRNSFLSIIDPYTFFLKLNILLLDVYLFAIEISE